MGIEKTRISSLDPADWDGLRAQAHRMLDDILGYFENARERPVWQPVPDEVRARFRSALPREGTNLASIHDLFLRDILPYGSGNAHPGFMGWVQGGGTPVGMLAEMLAAGMNCNLGGRDHAPIEVERQLVEWMREIFGFPRGSTGLFVTGASMANLTAAVIARDAALGADIRCKGVQSASKKLTAYASAAVHGCVPKAMDVIGIGSDALRLIATDGSHRMDLQALQFAIDSDRANGFTPFLIIGTAGTVDIGAIDDLTGLADIAQREKIWFHVDGAYAALGMLAPEIAPRLKGIERSDSLAFDFHKWGQVPYSAGFLLVRHGTLHRDAFASSPSYLRREGKGLASGSTWPCDLGIDLSRGFQALKTWFTLKVYGTDALGKTISRTCELARYLEERIRAIPELELMAPVQLNVVCFRFRAHQGDRVNAKIVIDLQESGVVAPSTTRLNGRIAIRAAIVNHRTTHDDIDSLIENTVSLGCALEEKASHSLLAGRLDVRESRRIQQAAVEELNRQIELNPEALDLRVQRAELLTELGHRREAREEYLAALVRDPTHADVLNRLGTLLYGMGHRKAAQTVYSEAVRNHPADAASRVNLGNLLAENGSLLEARSHFETALSLRCRGEDPHLKAHQGMARVLLELGDEEHAARHRNEGFSTDWLTVFPYRGERPPVSLLLLTACKGGNIPVRHLLNDTEFQVSVLMADYYDEKQSLPKHHLVFNSIGDADLAAEALRGAESVLAHTSAPVINQVAPVLATGRANNARQLRNIPGVITPRTVTIPRESLESAAVEHTLALHRLQFPLLFRTPGFHTGKHFVKIDDPGQISDALTRLPGSDLLVMEYLDARGSDNKARKYRVMMIDGQLYPLHLAISSDWKIHYFTAEMAECPGHRAEDAAFLTDMRGVLGAGAMAALAQIQTMLGLDYAGIDFGLNEAGEVLLFEANPTMVILPPGPEPQWDYRRPAVEVVHHAVVKMLRDRASVAVG